jgi:hypothetical protein
MKKILLILLFFSLSTLCLAQSAKDEESYLEAIQKAKKSHSLYVYIAKYMTKQYLEPSAKALPKLEKTAASLKSKIPNLKAGKTKDRYLEKLKETMIEVEICKLWPIYHKHYLIKNESYLNRDQVHYLESRTIISKIEERYLELKLTRFPRVRSEFNVKYPKVVKKVLESK